MIWLSTLYSNQVSAFRQPCWLCPQADTWPDTLVDNRPRTSSSVGSIHVSKAWRVLGSPVSSLGLHVTRILDQSTQVSLEGEVMTNVRPISLYLFTIPPIIIK